MSLYIKHQGEFGLKLEAAQVPSYDILRSIVTHITTILNPNSCWILWTLGVPLWSMILTLLYLNVPRLWE